MRKLPLFSLMASLVVLGCGGGGNSGNSGNNSGTAPAITSATSASFTAGSSGTFNVTATGSPAPTLSETGTMPAGVTFNPSTGVLGGTPAANAVGSYPIAFSASNGVGNAATQNFTLTVAAAPTITSFNTGVSTITSGTSSSLTAVFSGGTASVSNNVGTVTSGTPVNVSPTTTTTYTLTVTNSAGASATKTITVTVVAAANTGTCASAPSGNEGMLSGRYAFLLKGYDSGTGTGETTPQPAIVGGEITFNGTPNNGLIVSGILDQNLNSTHGVSTASFTGVYAVGPDQRACLTINLPSGSQHYRVALSSINGTTHVAASGRMLDFDSTGPFTVGTLRAQGNSIPASLSGNFAFGMSSPQSAAQGAGKTAIAGQIIFTATAASGVFDINQNGQVDGSGTTWPTSGPFPLTNGTYSIGQLSGRGSLTITPVTNPAIHFILYAISPTDVLVMSSDDQTTSGLVAGEALQQSGIFSAASLSGTFIDSTSGQTVATPPTSDTNLSALTSNGTGSFTGANVWSNSSGTITNGTGPTGSTYTVDASTGRVLVNSGTGQLYYMVNQNEAFVVGPASATPSGILMPQTSIATPTGTYAYGTMDPQDYNGGLNIGIATFNGSSVTLTDDQNAVGGTPTSQTLGPLAFSVDGTGLGSISPSNSACTINTGSNHCQLLFYVTSTTSAVLMDLTNGTTNEVNPEIIVANQ